MQPKSLINRVISVGTSVFGNIRKHGHEVTPGVVERIIAKDPELNAQLPPVGSKERKQIIDGVVRYYQGIYEASKGIKESFLADGHAQLAIEHGSIAVVEGAKAVISQLLPLFELALGGDVEALQVALAQKFNVSQKQLAEDLANIPQIERWKEIYNIIVESTDANQKQQILSSLSAFLESQTPNDIEGVKEWFNELISFLEKTVEEVLPEEGQRRVQEIFVEMNKERLSELEELHPGASQDPIKFLRGKINEALAAPEVSSGLQEVLASLSSSPELAVILQEHLGVELLPGVAGGKEPGIKEQQPVARNGTTEKADKPEANLTQDNVTGWGNGYGKWVMGLGSAVLALTGYSMSESKMKSFILGIGSIGLGGFVASVFKPIRSLFGLPASTNDNETLSGGWGNGYGKWIIGLAGSVLTLTGFYSNEDKVKSSLLGIGGFGLGGILASAFSFVRNLCGIQKAVSNTPESSGSIFDIINRLMNDPRIKSITDQLPPELRPVN